MNQQFVRLMKATRCTQKELAEQLNITPGAVSHIVNGRNRPSQALLRLFRMMLNGGKGGAKPAGKQQEALAPWEESLLRKLRALNPQKRARVLRAAQAAIARE